MRRTQTRRQQEARGNNGAGETDEEDDEDYRRSRSADKPDEKDSDEVRGLGKKIDGGTHRSGNSGAVDSCNKEEEHKDGSNNGKQEYQICTVSAP